MAVPAQVDEVHRVVSTAFDAAFHRAVYPDLADPSQDPLKHYVLTGWREGRDPAPWFSTEAYLEAHPDVARSGAEPFFHFLTRGRAEGREVRASAHAEAWLTGTLGAPAPWSLEALLATAPKARPRPVFNATADRAVVEPEFDAEWYLAHNPDIAAAGTDPLHHFLITGWHEGRDPSPRFSVRDYLELYPDVAQAEVNPFVHYLTAGRAEGRIGRHELGFRYDVIARQTPVEARLEAAIRASAAAPTGAAEALARAIADTGARLADLHVTFSHDDPTASIGGMQLCLRREGARFAALGVDHLHLHPAKPWPMVRAAGEPGPLGVLLNGRRLGVYSAAAVAEALGRAGGRGRGRRSFAIHSLLGHDPDETAALLRGLGMTRGFFWLHDFASLCAGYHLLRNDVEDCAAPPPDSAACGICAYGPWRGRHLAAHRRLFEALEITVVAPSETTLAFWRAGWDHPVAGEVVLPHARLVDRGPAPPARKSGPFRVAYLGMPTPLKGWPIFRELAQRFEGDRRYAFTHLGGQADPAAPATFRRAVASEDDPHAMHAALEAVQPDAALVWPLCRETFSFTAYEAAAAGAAVITGPDSGNVAAFVAETGLGQVLQSEAALMEAFESGSIRTLARRRREARLHDLSFSGMTADLVEAMA